MRYAYFIISCVLLPFASMQSAFAEQTFPSYLSTQYCADLKHSFMTSAVKSLQRYKDQQLATRHRGGMYNIRTFVQQREEWLQECDGYLQATHHQRLFKDAKTTDGIFNAMTSVSQELQSLIAGVSYTVEPGGDVTDVAAQKFEHLFKLVDDHQTRMLMRGQVVYR